MHQSAAAILEGGFAVATVRWPWIVAWLAAAAAMLFTWALTACPPRPLFAVVRRTAPILAAGLAVGAAAWTAGLWTGTWWDPLRASTIAVVSLLARLIASDAVADPATLVVGTSRFSVRVLSSCSGYEGIGLVWVFLTAYLWAYRRTLRFPRAFLLIPIGTAVVWAANALRLTALIAIGTWVSPDIALGGFHTHSGSLLFSAVALSIVVAVRHSRFFSVTPAADAARERAAAGDDLTPAYLLPFLAIVATAMLTGMISTGAFDGAYVLRVFAAAAVLCAFRRSYREVHATWSWTAVAYGMAAFALWMALESRAPQVPPADDVAAALHGLAAILAVLWVTFRVVGSAVTVPIAEELASTRATARSTYSV